MTPENRLKLAGARSRAAVELARWVCLAAHVEPLLLRRARLQFMPDAPAQVEAELWFSPLVKIRGPRSILFYPEVTEHLRASLVRVRSDMDRAWSLLSQTHSYLPRLVRLEEEITWLALTKGPDAAPEIDEHFKRVVKALVHDRRLGLGRWAVTMLPHLPEAARATETADLLLRASQVSLYKSLSSVGSDRGWIVSDDLKSLVLQKLESIPVGVRLLGDVLEAREPPVRGDEIIQVPATYPRVVELEWGVNSESRRAHLIWQAGKSGTVRGVSPPVSVKTFAGDEHRVLSRRSVFRTLNEKAKTFLVTLRGRSGHEGGGVGWLVSRTHVLTGEHSFRRAIPEARSSFEGTQLSVRFHLLRGEPVVRAKVAYVSEDYGPMPEAKGVEALLLLELQGRLPNAARLATFSKQQAPSSGSPLLATSRGHWARFFEDAPSLLDGSSLLKPVNEAEYDDPDAWSGSPLMRSDGEGVEGMLRTAYVEEGSRPLLVPASDLPRLFPAAFRRRQTVFISYSHKDEEWKDRLVTHLGVLREQGLLNLWDDRQIGAGEEWKQKINDAMNSASVAILLVSPNSLTSQFILRQEVSRLLQRSDKEGLLVYPVIVKSCPWRNIPWLSRMQVRPRDGKPLASFRGDRRDKAMSDIATEIFDQLNVSSPSLHQPTPERLPRNRIEIKRLPITGKDLFGREQELKLLYDAWAENKTNVLSLVAWGGVGKSALVNHWLAQMAKDDYRGAKRVYGWSFYSQGTTDRAVSADQFIEAALTWFGDEDPNKGSPWDKGERLAGLIGEQRTLLVLDGLEPLQYPPGPDEGRLKDQALQALLRQLAARNEGLCLISTRVAVTDLNPFKGSTAVRVDLDHLSHEAGADLLRAQGVTGAQRELEQASREFGGHSLALTLLGSYLSDVFGGDVSRRAEVSGLEGDVRYGGHAQRVMASYENWFGEGPELSVLRVLGLFNRPADRDAVDALRAAPVIPGLTDPLQGLSETGWQRVLSKLRRARLLAAANPTQLGTLDTHPLVREHFGQQLKRDRPDAWREGNDRLYEHLKKSTKEFPETVEELAPLYAAVKHGNEAGRHQETLHEVYYNRILRRGEAFSTRKLGMFGADLAALAGYFDSPWQHPVAALAVIDKTFVLAQAGINLRALGRLTEAIQPSQAALEAYISLEDWSSASVSAGNLSDMYLIIGDLRQAVAYAEQSRELADKSGDSFQRIVGETALADALYQAGRSAEAEAAFRKGELMQKDRQPQYPLLYSVQGFHFCDLLLGQGKYEEVENRAAQTLQWAKQNLWLLDIALDLLSLGRAYLLRAREGKTGDYAQATDYMNQAADGLRLAGQLDYLPRGLLARADLNILKGDFSRARADLEEAMSIALRGRMGLHQADCHLAYARLYLAQGEKEISQSSFTAAREMVERMGYHRRDSTLRELEELHKA